jgi:hypothetical protein
MTTDKIDTLSTLIAAIVFSLLCTAIYLINGYLFYYFLTKFGVSVALLLAGAVGFAAGLLKVLRFELSKKHITIKEG